MVAGSRSRQGPGERSAGVNAGTLNDWPIAKRKGARSVRLPGAESEPARPASTPKGRHRPGTGPPSRPTTPRSTIILLFRAGKSHVRSESSPPVPRTPGEPELAAVEAAAECDGQRRQEHAPALGDPTEDRRNEETAVEERD